MPQINIKLNKEEKKLFEKYAKHEGKKLTTFIKDTILDKIEDEYDYKMAVAAHIEWKADNFETVSFEKLKEEYGL